MKRLCVFYRKASDFMGNRKIEWMVCKECQKKLQRGEYLVPGYSPRSTIVGIPWKSKK